MADYEGCWFQDVHPESRHLQKLFHSTMGAYSDPGPSSTLGPHMQSQKDFRFCTENSAGWEEVSGLSKAARILLLMQI